jgi:hypothetical protein
MVKEKLVSKVSCDPGRKRLQNHQKPLRWLDRADDILTCQKQPALISWSPPRQSLKLKLCRRLIKTRVAGY